MRLVDTARAADTWPARAVLTRASSASRLVVDVNRQLCCATAVAADHPLIGREHECATLGEVLAGRRRAAAFVLGEAGIGKSRLIEAASDIAAADGVLVLHGSCLPLSTSLPLLPIVDIVRECAGVAGGELLETALTRCRDFVRDSIDRLLSASPPRVDDSGPAASWYREQTFEAVRQAVRPSPRSAGSPSSSKTSTGRTR